ncbi:MAG TPA: phosphoribosyltransferase family protein [bacterium]|nr:phosphoribosyltransferase family protein [bacterium]
MTDPGPDAKKVRRIDWDEYSRLCRMLANKLGKDCVPQTVVGIAHGGVIVGATIATILGRDFFPIKFSRRVNARVVRKHSKLLVPPTAHLEGKVVLLVDDASLSGETMKAAIRAIKAHQPTRIVTAVLVQTGAYEPDYVASYFPGRAVFPWMIEREETGGRKPSDGPDARPPRRAGKEGPG